MASPVADSYTAVVGVVIAGGRFAGASAQFEEGAAGEYSLAAQFPDVDGHAVALRVKSGTLPAGITLDPLGKRLIYDGTTAVASSNVTIEATPVAPSLTVVGSGVLPVMSGICFPKGVVFGSALGASQEGLFVTVRRAWNDGSIKHAVVTGVAAGGSRITFNTVAATGPELTHASIVAANPSAVVTLTGYAEVSLASLLESEPAEVWLSTPGMVECHYRQTLSTDGVAVEFQVRLFSSGAMFIRLLVENAYRWRDTAYASMKTLNGTVIIDSVAAYVYSGEALYRNTLHIHERWVGGTQYSHLVQHDVQQIARTKLVPNYGMVPSISESALNAIDDAYAINSGVSADANFSAGGDHNHLGLLPVWDVAYLVSGDARALRSIFANTKGMFNRPIVYRTGGRMIVPTDYPSGTAYSNGGGAYQIYAETSATLEWDMAHSPSIGYLAYLLTGEELYAEALWANAITCFQCRHYSHGLGTSRDIQDQVRGTAWGMRSIGQLCAIFPDSSPVLSEFQTWFSYNVQWLADRSVDDPTAANSEVGYIFAIKDNDAGLMGTAPFEQHFMMQALGHVSEIDPVPDAGMPKLREVRDWTYRGAVGILGTASSFCWTLAGSIYKFSLSEEEVGAGAMRTASQIFQTWAEINGLNYPDHVCSTAMESYPGYSLGPTDYWANLLPAISYAVEHVAAGADAAFARMTGASNWPAYVALAWESSPRYGVLPRVAVASKSRNLALRTVSSDEPEWAPAAGEIKTISFAPGFFGTAGGAVFGEINPAYQSWNPWAPSEGAWYTETLPSTGIESSRFLGFGGGGYYWGSIMTFAGVAFDSDSRRLVQYGAGHAAPNVTAPFCFDLADMKWKWLDTPLPWKGYWGMGSPPSEADRAYRFPNGEIDYDWGEVVGGNFTEFSAYDRPGIVQPIPSHGRNRLLHVPASILGNTKGGMLNAGLATGVLSGTYSYQSHIFDYDTSTWRRTQNNFPVASGGTTARGYALDPVTQTAVMFGGGNVFRIIDFDTETWRAIRTSSNSFDGANDRGSIHFLPIPRLLIAALPDGDNAFHFGAVSYDDILGTGAFSVTTLNVNAESYPLTTAGSYVGTNMGGGFGYCPINGCLYSINGSGSSNKYWKLTPPPNATTQGEYLAGTWSLTEHTFVSGTLLPASGQSWVFNRLSWDELSRSFLWFPDSSTGPVQAFRPEGV